MQVSNNGTVRRTLVHFAVEGAAHCVDAGPGTLIYF